MSMQASAWAWAQQCGGELKLALLALADNCDIDSGMCTVSHRTLSKLTGLPAGTLRLRVVELAERGFLESVETGGCDPLYRLRLPGVGE